MAGGAFAEQPIVRDLPPGLQIPAPARTGPSFDVDKATQAYLGLLSPQQRESSDRYFEGGYWLQLWELLWGVGACVLLLVTGISCRMRDWSQRLSRSQWISTPIYIAQFLIAMFLLNLPLSVYTDFLREHQYGLSEQPFGGWMRDQMVGLGANVLLGVVVLTVIYAAVRRTGARWWIWATGLTISRCPMGRSGRPCCRWHGPIRCRRITWNGSMRPSRPRGSAPMSPVCSTRRALRSMTIC
jgi:STE24 endopeptidase